MSLVTALVPVFMQGFPRVSGDEPAPTGWPVPATGFSPRERG